MRNATHVKGIINQKTMKLVGTIGPRKGFLGGRVGDTLSEMPEVLDEIEVVGAVHVLGFDDNKMPTFSDPLFSDPYRKKYRVTAITPYTCYVEPLKGEKHA